MTAGTADGNATVAYEDGGGNALADADGDPANGHQVALPPLAESVVKVVVTAEDGVTTREYTVTVTRDAAATVTNVAVTSDAPRYREANGANPRDVYGAGEVIEFTVTFSAAVDVDTAGGVPALTFSLGNANAVQTAAPYARGSGTTALVFAYVVQAADSDDNGIFLTSDSDVAGGALQLNGGVLGTGTNGVVSTAVATRGAQSGHKVDGSRSGPYVESLEVTSTPMITRPGQGTPDTYGVGEAIEFTLGMSEAVTVTGTPHLRFSLGGTNASAGYARGSGTDELVFAYTVQEGDSDDNGIFVQDGQDVSGNSAVVVESGESIAAMDDSADADLVNPGRGTKGGHRVDGDATAPTVLSIVRQQPTFEIIGPWRNLSSVTWRVTFSEDVRNVDAADFALGGTTATATVAEVTASTVFDVTASGGDLATFSSDLATFNGPVTLGFADTQDIEDLVGNRLSATEPSGANESYTFDNTPPTVIITVPATSTGPFTATFTFSEPVLGFKFEEGDMNAIIVTNGTASNLMSEDDDEGIVYTARITPTANGDVTVSVPGGAAGDAALNDNEAGSPVTSVYTAPNSAPTVANPIDDQTATVGTEFTFTVPDDAFADADTGDSLTYTAKLANDDPLPSWLTFDAATRTFTGTPTTAGTLTVRVTATDGSGASIHDDFDIAVSPPADTTAPTVLSIVRQDPAVSPTNADSLTWRVTFSEDVANVDNTDFTVSGTTAALAVAEVTAATVHDVTASGGNLADLDGTVTLGFASTQDIADTADPPNALTATTPTGTDERSWVLDNTAPTVTIEDVPAASGAPFTATFTFSEAVTGFTVGDIAVGNGAASDFTGGDGDTVFTATITPAAAGEVTVDVAADAAEDEAGNGNLAATQATSTYAEPNTAPTSADGRLTVTEDEVYSASTTDFTFNDLDGDSLHSVIVTALPAAGKGELRFDHHEVLAETGYQARALTASDLPFSISQEYVDLWGALSYRPPENANGDAFATFGFRVSDGTDESVAEYTMTIDITPVNDAPAVVNEIDDQAATVGTEFAFTVPDETFADADTGDTLTYTAKLANDDPLPSWLTFDAATRTFTGTPTTAGTLTVRVTATDGSGASIHDDFDIAVSPPADTTAPTVLSIVRQDPAVSPTNADSLTWRVTFSEDVANVDNTDFTVSGTTAALAVAEVTAATVHDVTASGGNLASLDGTVTLGFASTQDIADTADTPNALTATTPTGTDERSWVLDNTAPTVTIEDVPAASGAPFTATFTFSEAVTGFTVGDIAVGNGAASDFTGGDGDTVFTATITPAAAGEVTVDVAADAAEDEAGNGNLAATQAKSTYAEPNTAPTAQDSEGTTYEDVDYAPRPTEFNFTDDDGDGLHSVIVTALPAAGKGELKIGCLNDICRTLTASDLPFSVSESSLADGDFTYVPPANANGDAFATYKFRVSDGTDESVAEYTMTIDITPVNDAPTLENPIGNQSATVDASFSFTVPDDAFGDVDGDTLAYSATQGDDTALPSWLTFTAGTRTFQGTPGAGDAGTVTVKVTASDGTLEASGQFDIVVNEAPNEAPAFDDDELTRSVAENAGPGTNVGAAIPAAADVDGDSLTYTMEGADEASFDFDPATRQIATKSGVDYDFEAKAMYSVTVKADDGKGGTDTVSVAITLTDVSEPPDAPDAPTVTATSGSTTSLDAVWAAPANDGRPEILDYDLRYCAGAPAECTADGDFTDGPRDVTGLGATITGLNEGTVYQVQVRARNDEGDGGWSDSGGGSTATPVNNAPTSGDGRLTVTEDEVYSASTTDFTFNDLDGDSLHSVIVTALPAAGKGELRFDHHEVLAETGYQARALTASDLPFSISQEYVDLWGALSYRPPENANGDAFATFGFRVSDGTDESVAEYTMTIDITPVNDAPTSEDETVMTEEDTAYAFKLADFAFADADAGDALDSVTVVTLPGAGKGELKLDGAPVTQNQAFPQTAVVGGQFTYTPPANANGDAFATFGFRVSDGTDESVAEYTMTIDITPVNDAPTLENPIGNQSATVDASFSFTVPDDAFGDIDGDTLAYSATKGDDTALPSWLTFTAGTRTFQGTPGAGDAGTLAVKMTATDTDGESASDGFDIVVAPPSATACPAPDFGIRRQIWTGNLTVGSFDLSGIFHYGLGFGAGALDDPMFAIGANAYGILRLSAQSGGANGGDLFFHLRGTDSLTEVEKGALRLHVCDAPYDFSAAIVNAANNQFNWTASLDWSGESTRTLYLSLPANRAATGGPGVSSDGAAVSGDTLTADPAGIADPDGLPDAFTYQWLREDADGSNPAPIAGETSDTYTLTNDDVGKRVRVRVGFTDQLGGAETRESGPWPSSGVVAEDPANGKSPVLGRSAITGAPRLGATLTADTGAIDEAGGVPASGFRYQWIREDADGTNRRDIPGATGPSYTLTPEDAGKVVHVRVTFTDGGGGTVTVTMGPAEPVSSRPSGPGNLAEGRTVRLDFGQGLDPGSVPAPEDFEVRYTHVDDAGREVTRAASVAAVVVSGSTVTLTLYNPLHHRDAPRVGYTPGSTPLRYAGGVEVPGFGDAAVENRTPDTEPPRVRRSEGPTVDGATLRITFSEPLDPGSVPAPEGFSVRFLTSIGSASWTHERVLVERVSVSGRVVTLTLSRAVDSEKGVSLTYGFEGGVPIRDLAGNPTWVGGRFSAANRTVTGSAAGKTLTADGETVTVEFDEALDAGPAPAPGDFRVKRGPMGRTPVETVEVSGSTVRLTVDPGIAHGAEVRLSYVPGDSPLRFGDGRAVAGFGNLPVENRTGAPAPVVWPGAEDGRDAEEPEEPEEREEPAAREPSGPPLTAVLEAEKDEHGGDPTVRESVSLRFSEAPSGLGSTELGDLVTVTGGTLDGVEGSGADFTVRFRPAGVGPVTVRLPSGGACGGSRGICTPDGRALSAPAEVSIQGPIVVSVADAEVREAPGATLDFVVSLSRPVPAGRRLLLVGFGTRDGTAVGGEDYHTLSGRTYIRPGESSTTVSIRVLDDAHDEGAETMTLTLSDPTSGRIGDGTATGTIVNDDPMPRAWAARFGRTVAEQVLEAVEGRMRASRTPGSELTLAGQRIGLGGAESETESESESESESEFGAMADAESEVGKTAEADAEPEVGKNGERWLAEWLEGEADEEDRASWRRGVSDRELLLGSSFGLTMSAGGGLLGGPGGTVSLWGRSSVSRFDGRDGGLGLDGEVVSSLLGGDWALGSGEMTVGLIVGHSRGEGGYRGGSGNGTVTSTLTGLYPWGRRALSDRLTVWGAAGHGQGTLTLTPEGDDGESRAAMRTDLDLSMVAAGVRGVVLAAPPGGGPELAVTADATGVRTATDGVRGLAAAEGDVTRLRLGLEGTWAVRLDNGGVLTPSLAVGVRHDGGDAETGHGADVGGGIAWSDPVRGLSAELRARGLLSHESDGFRERGLSGTLAWEPEAGGRGPRFDLTHTAGGSSSGGVDALLGLRTMEGLASGNDDDLGNRRLEARFGYGFPVLEDRFTWTPEAGISLWDTGRDYTLGWRLVRRSPGRRGSLGSVELSFEARRHEGSGGDAPRHGVGLRLDVRW